jgi:hypothetical protein
MKTLPFILAAMVLAISGVASADIGLRCVNAAQNPLHFNVSVSSKSAAIRFGKFETSGYSKGLSGRSFTAPFYGAQNGYTKFMGRVPDLYDAGLSQSITMWYKSEDISNPRVRVLMSVSNPSALQDGGTMLQMLEMTCLRQD